MKTKCIIATVASVILSLPATGQTIPARQAPQDIDWNSRIITEGVVLKSVQTRLFNSDQAIYIVEVDTTAGQFEFGVAAGDKPLITSAYAAVEGVLAAINGTFFNMQEGYNVHFVRVNDSVVAVTDEKEFGIRATGLFAATGEAVDISSWGPEKEDAGLLKAEDAIVSGPLLMDDGREIELDSISFNRNRHPRSLLGITPGGKVLFIAVDGRQPGYAEGMSLFELRELAQSLGCTEILNLDGGGSTTLYVKGETAAVGSDNPDQKGQSTSGGFAEGVVNRPSGRIERPVPSIVFVKKIE